MDAREYLFYGFGQVAYSMALSDGKVQRSEKEKLHDKIEEGLKKHDFDYDFTEIIFTLLDQEDVFTPDDTYNDGIKNMKLGSHKLTPELKNAFSNILETIAESFPPVTIEEQDILTKFRADINQLNG